MERAKPNSRVAVLGASPKEDRYSFKAVKMLKEHGHQPVPVHPRGHEVLGLTAVKSLSEIEEPVDTLTMYVNSKISSAALDEILKLNPRRVVFNPGSENPVLAARLGDEGVVVVVACTLVMLRTDQF